MIEQVKAGFEPIYEEDELVEGRYYWNYNDGDLFLLIENEEDKVTIASITGDINTYPKEGMIFRDEEIGKTIRPVEFTGFDMEYES